MAKQTQPHFSLPTLNYDYDALWPYITEEQLRTHHQKHHQGYVNKANQLLKQLQAAHRQGQQDDREVVKSNFKDISRALAFNISGHILHSIFWKNLRPVDRDSQLPDNLQAEIDKEFGSLEQFKQEFAAIAQSVEGSGWACLVYSKEAQRLLIIQVEKHNINLLPAFKVLMVVDVWEHAYYIDYRNERKQFLRSFWEIVNWEKVAARLKKVA